MKLFEHWSILKRKMIKDPLPVEDVAGGWALGMFIGCAVPFGLQLLVSIPLAMMMRVSKIGATLGTLITNPVTIFFIYPVQTWVVNRILFGGSLTLDRLMEVEWTWGAVRKLGAEAMVSFFLGGLALALILSPITYFMVKHIVSRARQIRAARRAARQAAVPVVMALVAFCAGCSSVRDAREAQADAERLAAENAAAVAASFDLSGRSLSDLVDFAMTNRPSVASARLAVEDARLAVRSYANEAPLISRTPWLTPKPSISGGYSESSPATHFRDLDWKTDGGPSAGISMDLLIWDFGRHDAKLSAMVEQVTAAELELVNAGYTVFGEVASAYFGMLEREALLEVAYTNEYEFAMHLERAESRLRAGEETQLDYLRAKLDSARAREAAVEACNAVKTARAEFMRVLGIDASDSVRGGLFDPHTNALEFVQRGFQRTVFPVQEAFAFARTNSPTVRIERTKLRAASDNVDFAIADMKPSVSASASIGWTDPLWVWKWGLSAVQVFNWYRKSIEVDRSVVALHRAEAAVDAEEQRLSAALEKTIADRDTAAEAYRTAGESLKSARENLELVRSRYEIGEASRVDFTDAVAACTQALGDRISAFYRGQRAESALFSALGAYPVYDEKKLTEELK